MPCEIEVTTSGHFAVVEICRPPANYFDHELIAGLVESAQHAQT